MAARQVKDSDGPFPWLFDLEEDERETTNVANKHPDVVKRLTKKLEAFGMKMTASKRKVWTTEPKP